MWSLLRGWSYTDLQVVETHSLVATPSLTFFWIICCLVFNHCPLTLGVEWWSLVFLWHVLHKLLVPCNVFFLRMLGSAHCIPDGSTVLPFCRGVKSSINVLYKVLAIPTSIQMLGSDAHVKSDIHIAYHTCVCILYTFLYGLKLLLRNQHLGVSCS